MAVVSKNDNSPEDDLTWVRFGSAPLIVTLVLPLIIGVILLLKCILNHCCVRKSTAKDEMYGVEGRMTILVNSETPFVTTTTTSAAATVPSAVVQPPLKQHVKVLPLRTLSNNNERPLSSSHSTTSSSETNSAPKESSTKSHQETSTSVPSSPTATVTVAAAAAIPPETVNETIKIHLDLLNDPVKSSTLHRQLPDLPLQPPPGLLGPNPPRRSSSLLSHDGTSELYATVGEIPNPDDNVRTKPEFYNGKASSSGSKKEKPGSSRGLKPGPSSKATKDPSSDSETYGNNPVHHPYAKLKRNVAEHPYARVRTGSTGTGGDEETDTDNYDTPQPYAQIGGGSSVAARLAQQGAISNVAGPSSSSSSSRDVPDGSASSNGNAGAASSSANPVPPRRTGRQWRRGSHPPAQAYDNQAQHFSGDSQDSRGYTSISVREPLSNIMPNRSQPGRMYDSHYATVSDDSEEMYAAIEDAEGNYMRIPGDGEPGGGSRHWHGPNIASPIPERREANSPLPPPPVPPLASPPELSPTGPVAEASIQPSTSSAPPVYAQVTKKGKKNKAPVTPTSSTPLTSSQDKKPVAPTSSLPAGSPQLSTSSTVIPTTSSIKSRTTTNNDKVMSPSESSEPRRWSKADISYSEFDVVREPLYSTAIRKHESKEKQEKQQQQQQQPPPPPQQKPPEVLDEDNYNVIPDQSSSSSSKLSRGSRAGSGSKALPPSSRPPPIHQNNYQEISELDISNPYHEIQQSDYYQEIGGKSIDNRNGLGDSNLYQEIDKGRPKEEEDEEVDDDDPADQFYETVKPAGSKHKPSAAASAAAPMKHLPSPSHSQGSVTSLDRKHGYEKLKKKAGSPTVVVIASDDDDDEDDDTKNEDSLYERVKYPPYERLKESRDDLRDLPLDSAPGSDQFYEDIGYSRVKPKKKLREEQKQNEERQQEAEQSTSKTGTMAAAAMEFNNEAESNLDQLYARVDKTKKKKNTKAADSNHVTTTGATATSNSTSSSTSHRIEIREQTIQACIVLRTENEDESIEYI